MTELTQNCPREHPNTEKSTIAELNKLLAIAKDRHLGWEKFINLPDEQMLPLQEEKHVIAAIEADKTYIRGMCDGNFVKWYAIALKAKEDGIWPKDFEVDRDG